MQDNSIKSFIFAALKPVKFRIAGLFLVGLTWAIDLSLRPYILKIITNRLQRVNGATVVAELINPLLLYTAITIFVILMYRFHDYLYLNINPILKRLIGEQLMQRMMQHSLVVFQNNLAGSLGAKVKDVMSGVPDLIKILDEWLALIVGMLIATFTLCTINYLFALLLIAWLLIFVLITFASIKRAKILCEEQAEVRSVTVGQIIDILSNIISVKLFASRAVESKQLTGYLNKYVTAEQKRDWYFLRLFAMQGASFVIYQTLGFVLLVYLFQSGKVTTGDFVLLVTMNIAIINQLWSLSKIVLSFTEILGSVNQGLKVALQQIDISDQKDASKLQVTEGKIEFDKIEFNYPGVAAIFSSKSIIIYPGQKVGLVGYSGGGKSTFVNLILRLYDINAGQILIDGQNIQTVTQDSLHQNIAMIPQDPTLFHRSLFENIRYGDHEASEEQVILAAKQAHAHEFIMQLPQQYESLVGERGIKLSGGQRQRIAIARAILKNAPIFILDEATSQLDSITEQKIQDSLSLLMQDKTTIVIAHRLSTLLRMDRILVFHQGKIVEDGPHSQLVNNHGLYKTLWDTQVGGFIINQDE